MSREELKQLFSGCLNYKHKVMFRLLYSSGLRRMELLNLRVSDIDTKDGKMRIRVNSGKGSKDRYTVLSHRILKELRRYFIMCKPRHSLALDLQVSHVLHILHMLHVTYVTYFT